MIISSLVGMIIRCVVCRAENGMWLREGYFK